VGQRNTESDLPLEDLANRLAENWDEGFGMILQHYYGAIYSHAYRLVQDAHEAEDLCQEAFYRFELQLKRWDAQKIKTFGSIQGYLCRIVTNRVANKKKSKNPLVRQRAISLASISRPSEGGDGRELEIANIQTESPETEYIEKNRRMVLYPVLYEAINQLAKKTRQVVVSYVCQVGRTAA
jgi:RNA polymerase sigma-70 factor (ECF subfamily)